MAGADLDVMEFLGHIRAGAGHTHRLVLQRKTGNVEAEVASRPMRSLLRAARQAGQDLRPPAGGGGGGGCVTCRTCRPTVVGWTTGCGTGRRCEGRCLVA